MWPALKGKCPWTPIQKLLPLSNFKGGPPPSKKVGFIYFNENPLQIIKMLLFQRRSSFCS